MTDVRQEFDPETGEVIEPATAPNGPHEQPKPRRRRKMPKRVRAPIPTDETKRQKFVRLASGRFDRIVKAIHGMRSLGRNQASYEYGDADIDRITNLLVAELEQMAAEMRRRVRPAQTKLDLQ